MTARVVMAALAVLLLSSLLLFSGPASAIDFGLHLGDDPETFVGHSGLAWAVGADIVPLEFRWDEVEWAPGRFAWTSLDAGIQAARRSGLRVVGVLYYPESLPPLSRTSRAGWPSAHIDDWDYFVHRVVARYAGEIDDWIVVRERGPGGDPFLTAAEAGVDAVLAQVTADALHRANPAARLLAAVPGADLRWLSVFAAQGGLRAVDGLALDVNRWPVAPEGLEVVIDDVAAIAADLGYAPALWVWRFGYPTHLGLSWGEPRRAGVAPKEQAAFLVRAHVIAAAAGVEAVIYDELLDRSYDVFQARDNFGLYEYGGQGKPAAFAYMTMTRLLSGLKIAPVADWPTVEETGPTEADAGPNAPGSGDEGDVGRAAEHGQGESASTVTTGTDADVQPERAEGAVTADASIDDGQDGAESAAAVGAAVDDRRDDAASAVADGEHADSGQEGGTRATAVGVPVDDDQGESAEAMTGGLVIAQDVDITPNPGTLLTEEDVALVLGDIAEKRVSLHVHHFAGNGRHVLVAWTSDRAGRGNADALNVLSGMRVKMVDLVGRHIDELSVGPEPIYIELTPAFSPL